MEFTESRFPETENPACWLVEFLLFKFKSYVEFLRLNEGVVNAERPASLDRGRFQAGILSLNHLSPSAKMCPAEIFVIWATSLSNQ